MSDDVEGQRQPELPSVRVDPERMGEHRVLIELGTVHRRFSAGVDHLKQTVAAVLIAEFGMEQEAARAHAEERVTDSLAIHNISAYMDQLKAQLAEADQDRDRLWAENGALRKQLLDVKGQVDAANAALARAQKPPEPENG